MTDTPTLTDTKPTVSDETSLIEKLQDVGCNREPFTSDHADCICRITNKAADEISRLTEENERLRKALEFYATCGGTTSIEAAARYDVDLSSASEVLTEDCGDIARTALSKGEGE